jgi:hypothetical protein
VSGIGQKYTIFVTNYYPAQGKLKQQAELKAEALSS